MKHTVIALFDQPHDAHKAAHALQDRGWSAAAVHVTEGRTPDDTEPIPPASEIEGGPLTGLLHRLCELFGVEEPHLAHYEDAVRRGSSVVQVDAPDETQAATASDALLALGAARSQVVAAA